MSLFTKYQIVVMAARPENTLESRCKKILRMTIFSRYLFDIFFWGGGEGVIFHIGKYISFNASLTYFRYFQVPL